VKSYRNSSLPKVAFQSLMKNLTNGPKLSFGSTSKLTALSSTGLKSSMNDPAVKGISFGSPSSRGNSRTQTETSGSSWAALLGGGKSGILGCLSSGLLGGLGVGQLLSGAIGLLGLGSSSKTLPPLQRFTLPDSQQIMATIPHALKLLPVQSTVRTGDRLIAPGSLARPASQPAQAAGSRGSSSGLTGATPGGQLTTNGHQVHVHVSALDAQSFMDRSNDIAKAVKSAMLQSSSLNDVISEI
jgi:hypothetical protein